MPLMPYMSPAAIGCMEVRFAGAPVSAYRCPIASSTASGQPSPEEEETVMTAESATSRAASAPVSTGTVRMLREILQLGADSGRWWGTGAAAGLARLQLGGKLLAYGRLGRTRRPLEHQLGGPAAGLPRRHGDAAQRGPVQAGIVYVVEADHSDVGADVAAQIGDRVEDAEGDDVAEADDAVDRRGGR